MKSNIHKKMTCEDKFERKWWVDNRAKRVGGTVREEGEQTEIP